MYMDIGYGLTARIGGTKYALFVVNGAPRYKYIFKIKSFKKDTFPAFKQLMTDMGFAPKKIVTDFYYNLMGK